MKFRVMDTDKPLAPAAAIVEMGNRVVLEDGPSNPYIENVATGQRVMLRESGGMYAFDVECFEGWCFTGLE